MDYEILKYDFIKRTLTIIEQYEKYVMKKVPKEKQFEVTLLINCLLGLLVLPKAKERSLLEHIPKEPIKELGDWGLKLEHISIPKDTKERDKLTLKSVIRHMRNSVAHFNLKAHPRNNEITHLEFWDYPPKTYEKLETLPLQVEFPNSLKDKIRYDSSGKRLIFEGIMDKRTKNELLALSTDPPYRKAIDKLSQKACINFKAKIPVKDLRDFVKRLTESIPSMGLLRASPSQ